MRLNSATVLALFCCLAAPAAPPTSDDARVIGWRGDLDAWLREVGRVHQVLRTAPLPERVVSAADRFRRLVPKWSDERALAEMMRLAALAGDGHTYVLPFGAQRVAARVVPLRFYQFSDGLYVIDAEAGLERWIGARVLSLAGVPENQLMGRLRPFVARDNDMGILWAGPLLLRFVGYLEAITDQRFTERVPVRLRDRSGSQATIDLSPVPPPRMHGLPKLIASRLPGAPPPPIYLRDVGGDYWFEEIQDGFLYLQFNQVQDSLEQTLASFAGALDGLIAIRSSTSSAASPRVRSRAVWS